MSLIQTVYVLKNGSFEGVDIVGIYASHQAAEDDAKALGLTEADGTGGYYIDAVDIKV